jgi:hypothetical protein
MSLSRPDGLARHTIAEYIGTFFKTFIDGPADIEQLPPQGEAICFAISDLSAIHPFREGNGRSQLAFLHLVAVWVLIWVHRIVALASDAAAAKTDS